MPRLALADHRTAIDRVSRRLFLHGGISIGALSLLTGCDLQNDDAVDRVVSAMLRWNDRMQALLFSCARLAPT
jgi:hypothetical protein